MNYLSGKDKKNLKLPKGYSVSKKDEIYEKDSLLYKDKEAFLIKLDGDYIPHIKSLDATSFKSVYVDRGAIPFVIKGADLMRPGIELVDSGFSVNDIVLVCDNEHKKVLAVGRALFESSVMSGMEKGKVVKILHYVGDGHYWLLF